MHDLFEITTRSVFEAAANGITVNLSPGVGNTFMACAFLGAEVDRGVPANVTVYIGNPCLASARASVEEKIAYFNGTLPDDVALQKITRNSISNLTAKLAIGVKDHMGHCIQSDEDINAAYEITSKTGLLFATHIQDPIHAERVFNLSKGRPLHFGHLIRLCSCNRKRNKIGGQKNWDTWVQEPGRTLRWLISEIKWPGSPL